MVRMVCGGRRGVLTVFASSGGQADSGQAIVHRRSSLVSLKPS
jgi:hypothetical protein